MPGKLLSFFGSESYVSVDSKIDFFVVVKLRLIIYES